MVKSAHLTGAVSRKAGGLFGAVSRLAQSQCQLGLDVKVLGLWDEFAEADGKSWEPVPVEAFKLSWPKPLGRAPQMLAELEGFAPDISHTHGLWLYSSVATKRYSVHKNRPYVISPHGMLDPWALKNSRWKKAVAYRLFEGGHLHGARCFRALCQSEADSIRQVPLKNDIVVIPNGIDLPAGPFPAKPPWSSVIDPGKKVLLFLSRIHPKKGLVNLLKAWARSLKSVKGEPNEWIFVIAGWEQGGHEQELKDLATELGLAWKDIRIRGVGAGMNNLYAATSVVFVGPQFDDAKKACYHHCDAFVLPSFSEGLPMVVLESWAYSKPVIMTPECNLPEGFKAGAALKAETTEASLTAALNELRSMSKEDRAVMGRRGHELVLKQFTWNQVASQLQTVHQWILGGGAKPDCLLNR